MQDDLLEGAPWVCAATPPGEAQTPEELDGLSLNWHPVTIPGTAAAALRAQNVPGAADRDYDAEDWWFRCVFPGPAGKPGWDVPVSNESYRLGLDGLATVADVWLNGRHVHHGENMFIANEIDVSDPLDHNELLIRCTALGPLLAAKRPRPRWKTSLVRHQNLRWYRTTLFGRMPAWAGKTAPVGPVRPVWLKQRPAVEVVSKNLIATCEGEGGKVQVALRLRGSFEGESKAVLRVGGATCQLEMRLDGEGECTDLVVSGVLTLDAVERWWPHTHGSQTLYQVDVEFDGQHISLGKIGFRRISVDRSEGGFQILVNDIPVFCRGACWVPIDPVSMASSPQVVREALQLLCSAHMNMVRITGTTIYEGEAFFDACDEFGMLIWQDCMFANMDPPQDDVFTSSVESEIRQVLGGLQGRPSLVVVCGGSEVEQQASMLGLPPERRRMPLFEDLLPELVMEILPGTSYVTSSPSGGDPPFRVDTGVGHYYGVGAYLRPPQDARRANVSFAAESLAFATPPERQTVDEVFGSAAVCGHHPAWKMAVPRDVGSSWDFEDVRDHYVRELFGVDTRELRFEDPDRALDLGRAVVAELVSEVFTEWRRPGSRCGGGLVLNARDVVPGPGWGLIDSLGRPKAPWYAMRRVLQPVAVLVTDEGVNGLRFHVVNDTAVPFAGRLRVELFARGETLVESADRNLVVPPRGALEINSGEIFDGFRDVNYAYRFGGPSYDVVGVTLSSDDGSEINRVVHLPLGLGRPIEPDLGLAARCSQATDGTYLLHVSTRRFAQFVVVDVPGWRPSDSWFHLAPGQEQVVRLFPRDDRPILRGEVRALNCSLTVRVTPGG